MDPNRRLLAYLKPEWRTLVLGLVCMGGYALLSGFSIGMIYPVVDGLLRADPTALAATPVTPQVNIPDRLGAVLHRSLVHLRSFHFDQARESFLAGIREALADTPRRQVLGFICIMAMVLIFLRNGFDYLRKILFTRLEQRATEAIHSRSAVWPSTPPGVSTTTGAPAVETTSATPSGSQLPWPKLV